MNLSILVVLFLSIGEVKGAVSSPPDYSEKINFNHKYVAPRLSEIFMPNGPLRWLERNMAIQLGKDKARDMIEEIEERNLYPQITTTEMISMAFNFDFQRDMNATMHRLKKKDPADKMIEDACKTLIEYEYLEKSRY